MVSAGGVAGDAWDAGLVAGYGAGPARWLGKRPRRPAPPVPSSTPSPSRPRPRWSSSEPGTWGRPRGPRPVSRRVGDGGRRPAGVREPRALPEADRVVAAPVGETFGWLPVGPGTAVVVAMRNQDLDYEATAAALRTPARYVGLIGARRKAILVTERLVADGVPDRARTRAPGAHRARHRGPHAGGDRRLDPRRVAHGPAGRHRERAPSRRAALREGRRARSLRVGPARATACASSPPESRPEHARRCAPAGPLPLPLRNRLAELILEAFEPGDARATLFALAAGCALDGSAVDARDADRLLALGWFEPLGPGRVRLRGAHRPHGRTLAERAGRAASVTREWRDRGRRAGCAARSSRGAREPRGSSSRCTSCSSPPGSVRRSPCERRSRG